MTDGERSAIINMTLKLLFVVLLDISYYLIDNIRNEITPQLLYRYYTELLIFSVSVSFRSVTDTPDLFFADAI